MSKSILDKITDALILVDAEKVESLIKEAVNEGISPTDIILKGLSKGLEIVGEKYEKMEYFLTELILAAEIMKRAMRLLRPYLKKEPIETLGVCIMGTVRGDIHDLGKNLVIMMLSREFEVYDLGVDVPSEAFVEKVKETKADLLGLSAMLLSTMPAIKEVIDLLKKEGIRGSVKVIVGGRVLSQEIADEYDADGYAKDAIEAVRVAKRLTTKVS